MAFERELIWSGLEDLDFEVDAVVALLPLLVRELDDFVGWNYFVGVSVTVLGLNFGCGLGPDPWEFPVGF